MLLCTIGVVRVRFAEVTDVEIEYAVQKFLSNSRDRGGGKKERASKSGATP